MNPQTDTALFLFTVSFKRRSTPSRQSRKLARNVIYVIDGLLSLSVDMEM